MELGKETQASCLAPERRRRRPVHRARCLGPASGRSSRKAWRCAQAAAHWVWRWECWSATPTGRESALRQRRTQHHLESRAAPLHLTRLRTAHGRPKG
jgi:hypothetical protein